MGKISSYPSDTNVTTSDRLIGSDNENANETKNYSVGDIINLASSIIIPQVAGSFVPYTGATGDVDLGVYDINADAATFSVVTTQDIYSSTLFNIVSNPTIFIGDDSVQPVGLLINTSTKTFKLGDYNGNFNGTGINIEDGSSRITFVGGFNLSNGQGTAGQVLKSNGAGVTPSWVSLPSLTGYVPYTGATGAVDLGTNGLTADSLQANYGSITTELNVTSSAIFILDGSFESGGSTGTSGQILKSLGAGAAPNWVNISTLLTGYVPYTGATTGVNLGIYSLTAANVNANNVVPVLGGSGNIFFGGAGGYNVAHNGVFANGTDVTILGDSSSSGNATRIEIDDTNELIIIGTIGNTNIKVDISSGGQYISFNNAGVDLSLIHELYLVNGEGTVGEVLISNGAGSPPLWSSAPELATNTFWKGSFYDSITQTLAAANTATPVILRNTDAPATNGVSIVTDGTNLSRITFANAGVYNILFSAQLANSAGSAQTVDFWLRKNGSTAAANIANTNGKVQLQGSANYLMAAWNYFVTVAAGDYIQLVWAATSTNITMVTEVANALHPATPSIILTANIV
jgi:hypothetical protein